MQSSNLFTKTIVPIEVFRKIASIDYSGTYQNVNNLFVVGNVIRVTLVSVNSSSNLQPRDYFVVSASSSRKSECNSSKECHRFLTLTRKTLRYWTDWLQNVHDETGPYQAFVFGFRYLRRYECCGNYYN